MEELKNKEEIIKKANNVLESYDNFILVCDEHGIDITTIKQLSELADCLKECLNYLKENN